jgi:hypothetical protein
MNTPVAELEGTWEEIMAHAAELAGHRVRVTVLENGAEAPVDRTSLPETHQRMLEWLDERERTPLTDEEREVLDGLEEHLRNNRAVGDPLKDER